MIFNLQEILDIIIMAVAVGAIFMPPRHSEVELDRDGRWQSRGEWRRRLWFSILVAAPAIILHELGHKFVAMSFGLEAVFHAAYLWLGIGLALRFMNAGFIFLVPGYVSIQGVTSSFQHMLIAFAGPAMNLLLFLAARHVLEAKRKMKMTEFMFWQVAKRINGFLFVFNMLPIPGFDGWFVWGGILKLVGVI